ncbi:N-acetylmuramoyl-L-alanine amidase [Sphingomonas sp. NCPPB 2930]|uniref:N-acetylmuramoyl-L-alanine amidase family protein n=1 Tax=unclassified Sphingomonas TaxID=196159 RepID=UPI0028599A4C|nr:MULTISPECIES: N-acetylmuramoyl-L-alanine amidase [unclassified Sphingomonas]MDR6113826.1 N-acetylmuramoyl-L-alanine amidase [Sphingomonas sp. SORGH_AS_0789]MDR6145066.1 N-acetylmuramoyl-L-alanine amidase [Sphingomonas sp. SORGH_AS_0870]MDR6148814.1 N-acetylmuramoyl-L-alanine amidase [Sphingomonas sp. SORGH_AS_0742]
MAFRWTSGRRARHVRRVVLMLIAFLMGVFAPAGAWAATIRKVVVRGAQVIIRFDTPVKRARSVMLDEPRRVSIDVTGASPNALAVREGVVRGLTQRRIKPDVTRLDFDLAENATIFDGGFDDDGRQLSLTLKPVRQGYTQASFAGALDFFPFHFQRKPTYALSVPVPAATRTLPLPRVKGADDRPLVVIDAGHGGVDPGAINPQTGLREKDVTLAIAKAIRDTLVASGRVRAALTREDDRYILHRERYNIARRLHADLFISIHCDSAGAGEARGATAYTLSDVASDKEAARLAARENKADVIAGVDLGGNSDVSSILIDLTQRETMNASASFARLLGREAQPLIPVKPVFHRMASLMVLKAPDMPSILFETGYISNMQDAAFLASKDGQKRIAQAVLQAVEVHFARRMASR